MIEIFRLKRQRLFAAVPTHPHQAPLRMNPLVGDIHERAVLGKYEQPVGTYRLNYVPWRKYLGIER